VILTLLQSLWSSTFTSITKE